mmetsp:Transcript_30575/g.79738  ORF Transcript_30575/g.79738 Transcript_30575/m.79738 type:complete len:805 (-) Transcript_30575:2227-4641(-)
MDTDDFNYEDAMQLESKMAPSAGTNAAKSSTQGHRSLSSGSSSTKAKKSGHSGTTKKRRSASSERGRTIPPPKKPKFVIPSEKDIEEEDEGEEQKTGKDNTIAVPMSVTEEDPIEEDEETEEKPAVAQVEDIEEIEEDEEDEEEVAGKKKKELQVGTRNDKTSTTEPTASPVEDTPGHAISSSPQNGVSPPASFQAQKEAEDQGPRFPLFEPNGEHHEQKPAMVVQKNVFLKLTNDHFSRYISYLHEKDAASPWYGLSTRCGMSLPNLLCHGKITYTSRIDDGANTRFNLSCMTDQMADYLEEKGQPYKLQDLVLNRYFLQTQLLFVLKTVEQFYAAIKNDKKVFCKYASVAKSFYSETIASDVIDDLLAVLSKKDLDRVTNANLEQVVDVIQTGLEAHREKLEWYAIELLVQTIENNVSRHGSGKKAMKTRDAVSKPMNLEVQKEFFSELLKRESDFRKKEVVQLKLDSINSVIETEKKAANGKKTTFPDTSANALEISLSYIHQELFEGTSLDGKFLQRLQVLALRKWNVATESKEETIARMSLTKEEIENLKAEKRRKREEPRGTKKEMNDRFGEDFLRIDEQSIEDEFRELTSLENVGTFTVQFALEKYSEVPIYVKDANNCKQLITVHLGSNITPEEINEREKDKKRKKSPIMEHPQARWPLSPDAPIQVKMETDDGPVFVTQTLREMEDYDPTKDYWYDLFECRPKVIDERKGMLVFNSQKDYRPEDVPTVPIEILMSKKAHFMFGIQKMPCRFSNPENCIGFKLRSKLQSVVVKEEVMYPKYDKQEEGFGDDVLQAL